MTHNTNEFWVEDYGAKGDGITDDAPSIMTAINEAGPTGGTVKLMPSVSLCNSPLIVPATFRVSKIEGQSRFTSGLNFPNGDGISYAPAVWGAAEMRDFSVVAKGTGITLGSATTGPEQSTVERILFGIGGGIGLDVYNAGASHFQHCDFFNLGTAIQISSPLNPDNGDNWIEGNFMLNSGAMAQTGVGISHLSGGGYKIYSNKINGYVYNICVNPVLSATQGMSALQIALNSIEGFKMAGILFQNQGNTGNIENVIIGLNEGGGLPGSYGIEIQSKGRSWIINALSMGNIWRGVNQAGGHYIDGVDCFNSCNNIITDAGTGSIPITIGPYTSRGYVKNNTITNYSHPPANSGSFVVISDNGP